MAGALRVSSKDEPGELRTELQRSVNAPETEESPAFGIAGVRFRESDRVLFVRATRDDEHEVGDWVLAETPSGHAIAQVVVSPRRVSARRDWDVSRSVVRRLVGADIERLDRLRREAASALAAFGKLAEDMESFIQPVAAEYSIDGQRLRIMFRSPDPELSPLLRASLREVFDRDVDLVRVDLPEDARQTGGLGQRGRRFGRAVWSPANSTTTPLRTTASELFASESEPRSMVSEEDRRYRRAKASLPRIGDDVDTPIGLGAVVAVQVPRRLVTVRFGETHDSDTFDAADLGY